MSSVPMPRAMTEEAVAEWLFGLGLSDDDGYVGSPLTQARAVLAMLREKVREAVDLACRSPYSNTRSIVDHVVSRVLGEEAPRA